MNIKTLMGMSSYFLSTLPTVLFDRAGRAPIFGKGKIEIRIYLSLTVRKYIVMGDCTVKGWQFYPKSKKLKEKCEEYEEIIRMMKIRGDELTIENFNKYVEGGDKSKQDPLKQSFIEFIKKKETFQKCMCWEIMSVSLTDTVIELH